MFYHFFSFCSNVFVLLASWYIIFITIWLSHLIPYPFDCFLFCLLFLFFIFFSYKYDFYVILCFISWTVKLFMFYFSPRFVSPFCFFSLVLIPFVFLYFSQIRWFGSFLCRQYVFVIICLYMFWFCLNITCHRCHFRRHLFDTPWHMLDMCVVITCDTIHVDILYCCCYCINYFSVFYRRHVCLLVSDSRRWSLIAQSLLLFSVLHFVR